MFIKNIHACITNRFIIFSSNKVFYKHSHYHRVIRHQFFELILLDATDTIVLTSYFFQHGPRKGRISTHPER